MLCYFIFIFEIKLCTSIYIPMHSFIESFMSTYTLGIYICSCIHSNTDSLVFAYDLKLK